MALNTGVAKRLQAQDGTLIELPASGPTIGQILKINGSGNADFSGIASSGAPATHTEEGSLGDMKVDGSTLYVHNGSQWCRLTLNTTPFAT